MTMKIKNFVCKNVNQDGLDIIEKEINSFTTTHDVIDIKISSVCNNFGFAVVYSVLYKED